MKLFVKILLFAFIVLIANVNLANAAITFLNIQETTKSFSFQNETPKTIYKAIKNDEASCCQNEQDLVDYRTLVKGCEATAAKTSTEIIASNGIKITGFTGHGVNRAIGSVGRQGVSPSSILDALKNPLKINNVVTDQLGRQSQRFIGQFGEVVVNPQTGRIISVNPTSSSKAAKLLQQLGR